MQVNGKCLCDCSMADCKTTGVIAMNSQKGQFILNACVCQMCDYKMKAWPGRNLDAIQMQVRLSRLRRRALFAAVTRHLCTSLAHLGQCVKKRYLNDSQDIIKREV